MRKAELLNHSQDRTARLLDVPLVKSVLTPEHPLAPTDLSVCELGLGLVAANVLTGSQLVNDFHPCPTVGKERKYLRKSVGPRARHVVKTFLNEVCRLFVLRLVRERLDCPLDLLNHLIDDEEDRPADGGVVGHLRVGFDGLLAGEIGDEVFFEKAALVVEAAGAHFTKQTWRNCLCYFRHAQSLLA